MFYRSKKTKRYQAPFAKEMHLALESNFCQTMRLNVQVDELQNMNLSVDESIRDTSEDPFYYEF